MHRYYSLRVAILSTLFRSSGSSLAHSAAGKRKLVSCTDFTVAMSDSSGDGWNGNSLFLSTSVNVTLSAGGYGTSVVCLEEGSYGPYACGGSDDSEVSWSVGGVSGSADDSCTSTSGSFQAGPELPSVPVKSQSACTPADEGMAQILNDYNASACSLLLYIFVGLQMGTWTSNSWTKATRECSRQPTQAQAAHKGARLALLSARAAPAKSSSSFRYHLYAQYMQ